MKHVPSARGFVSIGIALAILAGAGCVKSKVLVSVKPDGSGTLVVSHQYGASFLNMMSMQMGSMSEMGGDFGMAMDTNKLERMFYNEELLRKFARAYGGGVTFAKGREVRQGGAHGSVAAYTFEDVNDLQIDPSRLWMLQSMMMSMAMMSDEQMDMMDVDMMLEGGMFEMMGGGKANALEFAHSVSNGLSRLRVLLPALDDDAVVLNAEAEKAPEAKADGDGEAVATSVTVVSPAPQAFPGAGPNVYGQGGMTEADVEDWGRQMMKGFGMAIEVEVKGDVKSTTAAHRTPGKPNRCTIVDIDFDTLMDAPGGEDMADMERMFGGSDMPSILTSIREAPGFVREPGAEVVIQYR